MADLVYDSFNRSDGALGTADSGQSWQAYGTGQPTIVSNTVRGVYSELDWAYIDAGEVPVSVSVRIKAHAQTGLHCGIIFRGVDADDFVRLSLYYGGGTDYRLGTSIYVNGSPSYDFTSVSCTDGEWYTISLTDDGSTITTYLDGNQVDTITSTTHNTGTKVGLYARSTSMYLDDFVASSAAEEPTGEAALTTRLPVLAATGTLTFTGTAAIVLWPLTIAGQGLAYQIIVLGDVTVSDTSPHTLTLADALAYAATATDAAVTVITLEESLG